MGESGSGRVGWSGPARQEVRKVTPEPVSPHGDFPENCEASLTANYLPEVRSYAPAQASCPPC